MNLTEQLEKSISDLRKKWQLALHAAISRSISRNISHNDEENFLDNLDSVSEENFDLILKNIFLNSRSLGKSYQNAHSIIWERSDFVSFLENLGSPCLQGTWQEKTTASVLVRSGCKGGIVNGSRYCQYWREAIEGLVLGLSESVGFIRNSSLAVKDSECVDVFFDEEVTLSEAIWNHPNRWGLLPQNMITDLQTIEKKFRNMNVKLKFLGLAEKNLFYKLDSKENLGCGAAVGLYRKHLENLVNEKFPFVSLKDASPLAVYGDKK